MSPFGTVIGDVVADFEPGFGQPGEAATVEQFGLKAAPKRFGVRVVVAVAAPAHALLRAVLGDQGFKSGGRVLAARVGVHNESSGWAAHGQGPAQGLADQVFGRGTAHVPAHDFARTAVEPDGQVEPAAALPGQVGDV